MRFSLGTLILFVLFVSSLYALVMLRGPWYLAHTYDSWDDAEPKIDWKEPQLVSPDGTRILMSPGGYMPGTTPGLCVYENLRNGRVLCELPQKGHSAMNICFRSDDEIDTLEIDHISGAHHRVYRRRYRETDIGYITRPEFLLAVITGALLFARLMRSCIETFYYRKMTKSSCRNTGTGLE